MVTIVILAPFRCERKKMIKLNLLLECSLLTPKTVLDWIKSPLVITMMVKIRAWTLRPSSVTPIELRINNKHINQNVINE